MTIFMSFQWLTGKIKAGSARLASAVSSRTWVVRGPLSNRQMLIAAVRATVAGQKRCKMRPIVALSIGEFFQKTPWWKSLLPKTKRGRTRRSQRGDEGSQSDEPV